MKSSHVKISKAASELDKQIRALKKVPITENVKAEILAKQSQLRSMGSAVYDDGGDIYYYQSFPGRFRNGKKAVAVYRKQEGDSYWIPAAVFTFMTRSEAAGYFPSDPSNLEAMHCEFYKADYNINDASDNWPEFLDDANLRTVLEIYDAKGWFGNSGDEVYVTPREIINGQKIVILDSNNNDLVVDAITFTEINYGLTLFFLIVFVYMFVWHRK